MNSRRLITADRSDGIPGATFYADKLPNGTQFAPYVSFDIMKTGAQDAYNEMVGVLREGANRAGLEMRTQVEEGRLVVIYTKAAVVPDELDMPMRGFGSDVREAMAK